MHIAMHTLGPPRWSDYDTSYQFQWDFLSPIVEHLGLRVRGLDHLFFYEGEGWESEGK